MKNKIKYILAILPIFLSACDMDSLVNGANTFNPDLIATRNYTFDLTEQVNNGKIRAAVGRDRDVALLSTYLSAPQYNNIMLVGKTGVGKTSLMHTFALNLHNDKFAKLRGMKVVQIDLSIVAEYASPKQVSPAQYIELIDRAMREYDKSNTIFFVDEVQMVVGKFAGAEFGNLLKQFLDRVSHVVLATTANELAQMQVFHADSALRRRVQFMPLLESDVAKSTAILEDLIPSYEKEFGVNLPKEYAGFAARLGIALVDFQASPLSGIQLLSSACSRAQLENRKQVEIDDLKYATRVLGLLQKDEVQDAFALYFNSDASRKTQIDQKLNDMVAGRNAATSDLISKGLLSH